MSNKAVMMLDIESGVINTHIRLETRPDRFWISERQQLLYILNELRSQISVYSLDHPGLLSQIPLGEFRGEMVFDAKSDRLYVALNDQTVQVIDLALFRSLGYVSVKQDIDVMHLNIADEQLWVQEANNHVVSVVDLKNHEIIKQMGPSNENDR
ncbi:YncE family protein [Pontibacter sp. JAM-7]|uniref:YncE family protein n=1 Tax=Pontibacter sp. JAM-7 TaxID=3366581 RepID=UPI003AF8C152